MGEGAIGANESDMSSHAAGGPWLFFPIRLSKPTTAPLLLTRSDFFLLPPPASSSSSSSSPNPASFVSLPSLLFLPPPFSLLSFSLFTVWACMGSWVLYNLHTIMWRGGGGSVQCVNTDAPYRRLSIPTERKVTRQAHNSRLTATAKQSTPHYASWLQFNYKLRALTHALHQYNSTNV